MSEFSPIMNVRLFNLVQWNPVGNWISGLLLWLSHKHLAAAVCRLSLFVELNFSASGFTLNRNSGADVLFVWSSKFILQGYPKHLYCIIPCESTYVMSAKIYSYPKELVYLFSGNRHRIIRTIKTTQVLDIFRYYLR